jgi:predicted nucleic acid-binding protein
MIILDTNVISGLMKLVPEMSVVRWLDQQPRTSLWITSISEFEIRYGLQILEPGRRRSFLQQAFEAILARIGHRIASFDGAAAQRAADLTTDRRKKGRPGELRDTMIAGIVLANNARLATRNTSHFDDIAAEITNPWTL